MMIMRIVTNIVVNNIYMETQLKNVSDLSKYIKHIIKEPDKINIDEIELKLKKISPNTISSLEYDDFVLIEQMENKKKIYTELEHELIKLKDMMIMLHSIVKLDESKIKIIDDNIKIASEAISEAEFEIIYAETELETYNSTKTYIIVASIIAVLTSICVYLR